MKRQSKARNIKPLLAATMLMLGTTNDSLHADSFGSGGHAFTIDFVKVGNEGNADDAGAGGGFYSTLNGGVSYTYRMGVYEISQEQITKAANAGLANVSAGQWSGNQPATNMSWYEAAAFVNWLNTSKGHHAAYNLTYNQGWSMRLWSSEEAWQAGGENLYRHKDAVYFLPSEDEWYKAAYHKNDGVTANYWDYATGSNTAPVAVASGMGAGSAVYSNVTSSPANVNNAGGLSAYGTMAQNGNVWDWTESAYDGLNDSSSERRAVRGGDWFYDLSYVSSRYRGYFDALVEPHNGGFRVASVATEPARVSIATYAGLTIEGGVGETYGIQATTDLSSWIGVANVTLTQPTQIWHDSQSTAQQPRRFYRVVAGPITIP